MKNAFNSLLSGRIQDILTHSFVETSHLLLGRLVRSRENSTFPQNIRDVAEKASSELCTGLQWAIKGWF